jgi:hypothetical protein
MLDVAPTEVQTLDPEAIVLARLVLLDLAAGFEGGEKAENVVLMQLETLRQFGDAELVDVAEKLLHHVERMRHRLDEIIGFIASHCHGESSAAFLRASVHFGKAF